MEFIKSTDFNNINSQTFFNWASGFLFISAMCDITTSYLKKTNTVEICNKIYDITVSDAAINSIEDFSSTHTVSAILLMISGTIRYIQQDREKQKRSKIVNPWRPSV